MKASRWMDHLCPWVAWGAVAATGLYEPWELLAGALPLGLAALVEGRRLDLLPWRRSLEVSALLLLVADVALNRNLLGALTRLLFLLMGLRLALPRQRRDRRQLLLMAFLVFLTTAISTTDLAFLLASLAFLLAGAATLLHQNWEESASLRRGPSAPPPFRRLGPWLAGILALAGAAFLVMPRVTLGLRPLPALGRGLLGQGSGLSSSLDLAKEGPIRLQGDTVLRVAPLHPLAGPERLRWEQELGLLRGLALEEVRGMAWSTGLEVPAPPAQGLYRTEGLPTDREAEFFLAPSRNPILPLPYGLDRIRPPLPLPVRPGEGGSLRWAWLPSRGLPLRLEWLRLPVPLLREPGGLSAARRERLLRVGPEHAAAARQSLLLAPEEEAPARLAARLAEGLRTQFGYTLDNPSGRARNPLQDFLERSRAGHCEYFAAALALMLRARGVPARVVNGYRLGPWIEEGGYFRVTQEQAHAWVEWWDEAERAWRVEDGTPAGELGAAEAQGLGPWTRLADSVRYRWDRYVVRFSDEDQQAGVAWARTRLEGWRWQWPSRPWILLAGGLAALLVLRRAWPRLRRGPAAPGGLRALKPLLRRVPVAAQPRRGETARAWLLRLGRLRPDRAAPLQTLAQAVDAEVYGSGGPSNLAAQARAEARAWKRKG